MRADRGKSRVDGIMDGPIRVGIRYRGMTDTLWIAPWLSVNRRRI